MLNRYGKVRGINVSGGRLAIVMVNLYFNASENERTTDSHIFAKFLPILNRRVEHNLA
jgi:hypothetical protein